MILACVSPTPSLPLVTWDKDAASYPVFIPHVFYPFLTPQE